MPDYQRQTDQVHQIKLPSAISQAVWDRPAASVREEVEFQVYTHFVGNGSEIRIRIRNKSGNPLDKIRNLDKIEGKVYGNQFKGTYTVSDKAKETIYFEAELKKHGLKKKSEEMKIVPPITITNLKWSQQEARRGDILTLTADISGVPDGTEAEIEIYEHDADGAHDFITKFLVLVENKKIEAEWEYEYHEDTDEIPTEEESEKGYNPPEYFFRVKIGEVFGDSPMLTFKDWIEIECLDISGKPLANAEYVLFFPDGNEKHGRFNHNGRAIEKNVPPGKYKVEIKLVE